VFRFSLQLQEPVMDWTLLIVIVAGLLAVLTWEVQGQSVWQRLVGWWSTPRARPVDVMIDAAATLQTPDADDLLISAGRLLVQEGRYDDADQVFAVVTRRPFAEETEEVGAP